MKKILLFIVCATVMASCSKMNDSHSEGAVKVENGSHAGDSYQRALEVANVAPDLFATASTKSFGKRVEDGFPVISKKTVTKSEQPDTLLFVFNYAGDDGYVIVPKDERKGFVLAYSDKGSFNIADTAVNEIAKYIIENAMDYCQEPVEEAGIDTKWTLDQVEYKKFAKYFSNEQGAGCVNLRPAGMYDFSVQGPSGIPDSYYVTQGCKAILNVMYLAPGDIDPLLTTKWGQGYPYNLKAPLFDGKNAVTGCVATATSQVIAYHNFPSKYPTGTYIQGVYYGDTDTKIANFRTYVGGTGSSNPGPGVRDYISRLFRVVGDRLNNSWGPTETGAYTSNVPSVLRWFGYTSTPSIKDYNITELEQSLDAGYPVIISGTDTSGSNVSHAYVIDGYKAMHRGYNYYYFDAEGTFHKRTQTIYSTPNPPQRYVHINFGWDGAYNGFYLNSVFDTSDRDSWFETKANYNGSLRMITFLHP